MVLNKNDRLKCYAVIEEALTKTGFSFEQEKSSDDGTLDTDDILAYNIVDGSSFPLARLMPTAIDAGPNAVEDLAQNIRSFVEARSHYAIPAYHFVLCGSGWSDARVSELTQKISSLFTTGILIKVYTTEDVQKNGIQFTRNAG